MGLWPFGSSSSDEEKSPEYKCLRPNGETGAYNCGKSWGKQTTGGYYKKRCDDCKRKRKNNKDDWGGTGGAHVSQR